MPKDSVDMEYIIVSDTSIIAVNRGVKSNEASGIIYRNGNGELHTIDFETCAYNYKAEYSVASHHCIGERKMDESYFIFYTSGIKTKIVFDKMYVSNFFRYHILSGNKYTRFCRLQNYICQTKYTTLDLS